MQSGDSGSKRLTWEYSVQAAATTWRNLRARMSIIRHKLDISKWQVLRSVTMHQQCIGGVNHRIHMVAYVDVGHHLLLGVPSYQHVEHSNA